MIPSPPGPRSALHALFSNELVDGGIDAESIGRIHRGDIDDWVAAVARAGWFTSIDIAAIEQGWRADPRTLLDTLLTGADEITSTHCRNIWAAYDQRVSVDTTQACAVSASARLVSSPEPTAKHPATDIVLTTKVTLDHHDTPVQTTRTTPGGLRPVAGSSEKPS